MLEMLTKQLTKPVLDLYRVRHKCENAILSFQLLNLEKSNIAFLKTVKNKLFEAYQSYERFLEMGVLGVAPKVHI